jgi:hypothetical protein
VDPETLEEARMLVRQSNKKITASELAEQCRLKPYQATMVIKTTMITEFYELPDEMSTQSVMMPQQSEQSQVSTISTSSISSLKNFERKKSEKFSLSKPMETFSTKNEPVVVETLNATIELSDSDNDAKFNKINHIKRFSVLKTTKSIEDLDIMDRNENDGDQDMNGL